MTMAELRRHREEILDIARNRGISDVQVFGSVARGDARSDSDVDFLVVVEPAGPSWRWAASSRRSPSCSGAGSMS
jgi:predicted nucleotidyltransferase